MRPDRKIGRVLPRAAAGTLVTALLLADVAAAGEAADREAAALRWIATHAQPITSLDRHDNFDDLSSLREVVGDARVVGFGEPIHLGEEFLALRNRMFQFLVRELGFTAIALETGFTNGVIVDDYVTGRSSATQPPIADAFSFSDAQFEQNRRLIEWMRDYNSQPTTRRKVRFYGHSMVGRGDWDAAASRKVIDVALVYVRGVDGERARTLFDRMQPLLVKTTRNYDDLTAAERDTLTAAIADVVSLFERRRVAWQQRTSYQEFERAYRAALNAMQMDADKRASGAHGALRSKTIAGVDLSQNDAAMAANVRWMLEQEGASGRIFVFAHNAHVRKCPARSEYNFTSLGEQLRAMLGDDLVVIGSTGHEGNVGLPDKMRALAPSESVTPTATLARVDLPMYLLNLRTLPQLTPAAQWWNRTVKFRSNHAYSEFNPVDCFDALVFVRHVTAAQVLPGRPARAK